MEQKDVVITYETLFELLRLEKNREDLQKLDENFFEDVLTYMHDKRSAFEAQESQSVLFEADDKEIARLEYENIKKILKELYERREKKILNTSLNKARTGAVLLNTANMLPCENLMLETLSSVLSEFRKNILFKLANGEMPLVEALPDTITSTLNGSMAGILSGAIALRDGVESEDEISPEATPIPDLDDEGTGGMHFGTTDASDDSVSVVEEPKELKTTPGLTENTSNVQKVRVLASIGEIVGPDLQIYGPYDEGVVIELPGELARVLVEKKQAEQVLN